MVDPFGGVALGAMDAMGFGCRWYGCELEPRFIELGNQNLALWRDRWQLRGAVLLQGDSRRLCEVLIVPMWEDGISVYGPAVDCVVGSPPHSSRTVHADGDNERHKAHRAAIGRDPDSAGSLGQCQDYGDTAGQLGNMPAGEVDAVVSSPPYEGSIKSGENVLANMKRRLAAKGVTRKDSAVMRSVHGIGDFQTYSGGLGGTEGQTFWTAAREIVQQCHSVLKPGGVAIWVTKDFVRKGQRVPFSDDWRRLCESVGFVTIEWIKASLVKETRHPGLFGDVVERKERKSFFRRLAEKKGAPAIDHEDVIVVRKPVDGTGEVVGVDCVVSSPPYAEAIRGVDSGGLMGGEFRLGRGDMAQNKEGYGTTPGNLANMPAGKPDEVIG